MIIATLLIWGNYGITLRNNVQKLQNRAARVLTYSSYDVDAGYLFKLPGWKNLATILFLQFLANEHMRMLQPCHSHHYAKRRGTLRSN